MTISVSNTANTDTMLSWRTRTNQVAAAMTSKVVTVDSNATVGDAQVVGSVTANVVYATTLSGGNTTAAANMSVTSNVAFTSRVALGSSVNLTAGNSTHRVVVVNSTGGVTATKVSTSDLSDANVSSPANNDVLLYSSDESAFKNAPASGLSVANASYAANADKLDGFDSAYFANSTHSHAFSDVTGKPTTAQGYGLAEINLGNSTVNSVSTNTSLAVSDTLSNVAVTAATVSVSNSTVNTSVAITGITASNTTSTTVANVSVVSIGNSTSKIEANSTVELIGNSTVNAVVTATSVTLANSTVSIAITKPDVNQVANGNFFLGSNGTWQQVVANSGYVMTTFTANGTWTKPAGLKSIKVTVVGGGGGTRGPQPIGGRTSGAGGGGAAIKFMPAPSIPGPVTVTVGLGGPTASPQTPGGTSSFGAHASATGGATTSSGGGNNDGTGGTGSGGDLNMTGGQGGYNGGGGGVETAFGGGSLLAQTSARTGDTPTSPLYVSMAGKNYGGGSSGMGLSPPSPTTTGAVGGQGVVIVEEFY